MDLYLVRHAETFGNTGADDSADPVLTERGYEQARLLAERLASLPFDAVFCSPLLRAVETAQIILSRQKAAIPVQLLPELMEHQPPQDYSGLPTERLQEVCPSAVYPDRHALPQETDDTALERARFVLRHVRERCADKTVLLVAHGQFNTYLLLAAMGLPKPEGFNFSQRNACVDRVLFLPDGRVKAKLVNDVSHLPEELWT
jgi:broad specificity phosphatase PhoE